LARSKGEITLLLGKWKNGEASAFSELMLWLSALAQRGCCLVRRDVIQTDAGTVLVHELYLRLLNQKKAEWQDAGILCFAAKVMRDSHDHARETQA